jgi:hypothetical protein
VPAIVRGLSSWQPIELEVSRLPAETVEVVRTAEGKVVDNCQVRTPAQFAMLATAGMGGYVHRHCKDSESPDNCQWQP